MKNHKDFLTYILYFFSLLGVLSCMMLLTCESCNEYTEPQIDTHSINHPTLKDTLSAEADSSKTDSTLVDTVSTDIVVEETPVDSTSLEELSTAMTEEQQFIYDHFVEVKSVIPDVIEDIRYNTSHNFVGRRISGYEESVALLTKEASEALKIVADELRPKGYRIKIFDAYRPQSAVNHFRSWVGNLSDTIAKAEFYPDKDKSVLFEEGYISSRSRHCNGSTIDMTICTKDGRELDMGGSFDLFSERSSPSHTESLTTTQIANRSILRSVMESHGFVSATTEWWHFRLNKEPFPDRSFNFNVASISKLTGLSQADKAVKNQSIGKNATPKNKKVANQKK